MRKLLLLVFVAVMCVPSYGSILIYKTTETATVFDTTGPSLGKVTEKGYLVISVNLDTQDVCEAQQITHTGTSGATLRALAADVVFHKDVAGHIAADYSSGNTNAVLFGKTSNGKAVGLTDKNVARTLSGYTADFTSPIFSSGTFSATLDTTLTKNNQSTPIDNIVSNLITSLTKYTLVTDSTPPTPSPMTWAPGGEPNAISDTQITMTATTATDALTPPVQYYFTNKTITGHDSGWQDSPTYTDGGLSSNTLYTYNVMAEDSKAPVPNVTTKSADANATTHAVADTLPPDPNPATWASRPAALSDTQITMTATTATAHHGEGVQYYFRNKNGTGGHDSGWQDSATYIDHGLIPDVNYGYTVKAQTKALVPYVTAESVEANAVTGHDTTAPDPNPATFAIAPYAKGPTSIKMQATIANDDSKPVWYQFWRVATPTITGHLSGWQTDSNWTDTGLAENTTYSYQVQSKDSATTPNIGAWSTAIPSATTTKTLKLQINEVIFATDRTATTPTYQPVTVSIAAGTYNEDVDLNEPNITLQSASGAATTIIQLLGSATMGIDMEAGCKLGGSAGHGFTVLSGGNTLGVIDATTDEAGPAGTTMEVSYCDINSAAAGTTNHVIRVAASPRGVTIAHNNFFTKAADSAVYLGGESGRHVDGVTVSNNVCDAVLGALFVNFNMTDANSIIISNNTTDVGIDVGVGTTGTKVQNLTISGNTFNGKGIQLYEATESFEPNRLMSTTISGNTFSAGSNAYALLIPNNANAPGGNGLEPNDVNWASLTFTQNVILRTPGGPTFTVDNQIGAAGGGLVVPSILKAQHNYWDGSTPSTGPTGGCSGTGIGASISTAAYVTYQPFWTTATGTDANCP